MKNDSGLGEFGDIRRSCGIVKEKDYACKMMPARATRRDRVRRVRRCVDIEHLIEIHQYFSGHRFIVGIIVQSSLWKMSKLLLVALTAFVMLTTLQASPLEATTSMFLSQ